MKVPRTEPGAPRQGYVPPSDDVVVHGFVDEGLTTEAARAQVFNTHALMDDGLV